MYLEARVKFDEVGRAEKEKMLEPVEGLITRTQEEDINWRNIVGQN